MAREGIKVEGERSGHALEGDSNSRVSFSLNLSLKSRCHTLEGKNLFLASTPSTTYPSHQATHIPSYYYYYSLQPSPDTVHHLYPIHASATVHPPQLFFHARNLAHLAVNCQLCNKLFTPGYWPVILAFLGLAPKIPSLSLDLSASR